MTFVPENDLERALMRAASEPPARVEFYRLLLASDLLIIGRTEHGGNGNTRVSEGENLQIMSGEQDGKPFLPVFSSLTRLQSYIRDEQSYVALNGRALFEMTDGAYLILNPGSDYGKELLPEEIKRLLDPEASRPQPITVEEPTQVLIGQPAVYPHDLVTALNNCFSANTGVTAAYLVQIAFPTASQPPHPLIGIEMTGDWNALTAEIGRASAAAAPGMLFDLVRIDRAKGQDSIGDALLKTKPFYQRNKPFWRSLFN